MPLAHTRRRNSMEIFMIGTVVGTLFLLVASVIGDRVRR
jgi:hypothetical protein